MFKDQNGDIWHQVEPGVFYGSALASYKKNQYIIRRIGFKELMMCDWDVRTPETQHYPSKTVKSRLEVISNLENFIEAHPSRWAVYVTPGGVRGFLISHRSRPGDHAAIYAALNADPEYHQFSLRRGIWSIRINPKPRPGDYVARRIGEFGNVPALPELERQLYRYHDCLIGKQFC